MRFLGHRYYEWHQVDAEALLEGVITEEKRTTNRLLAQREKELSELESKFESERSEFQFLQQSLHPVKVPPNRMRCDWRRL